MSRLTLFIFAAGLAAAGCSHNSTKSENAAAPVAKPDAAKPAEKASAQSEATSSTKVECSVKGDERILEVRSKNKGCDLIYTKSGNEGTVASASHGTDYCEKALEKLRDKLKGAGYECK